MNEVGLQIGGRTYRVACAPGEEERVRRLGATIAEKLAALGNPAGPDAQNLLFAALLLADEVHEARERDGGAHAEAIAPAAAQETTAERDRLRARIAELESEQARLSAALREAEQAAAEAATRTAAPAAREDETRAGSPPAPRAALEDLAPALEQLAEMLEECADKLETRAAAS